MSWWPFDDNEENQTKMLKHLAKQQDTTTNKLEEIMAEFTNLNNSLAKLAADVDTKMAALKTENDTLKAENALLKEADATDQSNVDAAQAQVDSIDAKLTA